MCGRMFQTIPLFRLLQIARAKHVNNAEHHKMSYNVCPTTYIPVIKPSRFYAETKKNEEMKNSDMQDEENKEVDFVKWGHQSKYNLVINGRIQEMLQKRMFLNFIGNRCVVIMEGYYEWNEKKEPFSLRPKDSDHFLVAALYTDANEIIILTKDATPQLAKVHSRMPVILSHQDVNIWLNPRNTKDIQQIIQTSLLNKDKQIWKNVGSARIAPHVNSLKEKSVKCLMTVEEYKKELDKTGLMRFWKKPPAVEAVVANGEIIKGQQGEREQSEDKLQDIPQQKASGNQSSNKASEQLQPVFSLPKREPEAQTNAESTVTVIKKSHTEGNQPSQ